ncbi:MAG: ribose-phosphate diphosphokinase [Rhodospirillaceae bacterium]|nr:MAG: ribose-phosphate diphosphokinase [Rhodospirillaceae bacterium]
MVIPLSDTLFLPDAICGFSECAAQATRLAAALRVPYAPVDIHAFPDGESRVRVKAPGRHVALYRTLDHPNAKLIEVILAASALRDQGAARLTLIAPYLPYMRQDIAFHPGEAVSQKAIGQMLSGAFDRFVAVDPHLHRTSNLSVVFGGKPSLALTGASAIVAHLMTLKPAPETVVIGPDEESETLTRAVALPLGLNWTLAKKERHGDRDVRIAIPPDVDVAGRPVIIVDDVISSGATITTIARIIRDKGSRSIDVYATHALCDDQAMEAMADAGVDRLISCDGVPHRSNGISLTDVIVSGLRISP